MDKMDKQTEIDEEDVTPPEGEYIIGSDGNKIDGEKLEIYQLVDATDPILHEKIPMWDFGNPPEDAGLFSQRLVHTMMKHNGIGLAASQVGLRYRAFAMRTNPYVVAFNPRIVDVSEKDVFLDEGCLSYPYLLLKIKRPLHIRVRFQYPNGETKTQKFTGMTARVFLHEFDHLEGLTFDQRASRYHLSEGQRKLKFLRRKLKHS